MALERASRFDYATIPDDKRSNVEAATRRLHTLERRTSEAIIEIGKELIAVKADIGHGNFLPWLEAEFGWSYPTAARFMQVAERLGEISQIENFQPSALYALASPSTPDDVRVEFTELASIGKQVTHKDVQERIRERRHVPSTPIAEQVSEIIDADTGEIIDDSPPAYEEVDPSDPAAWFMPAPKRSTPSPAPAPRADQRSITLTYRDYGPDHRRLTARSIALELEAEFGDGFARMVGQEAS